MANAAAWQMGRKDIQQIHAARSDEFTGPQVIPLRGSCLDWNYRRQDFQDGDEYRQISLCQNQLSSMAPALLICTTSRVIFGHGWVSKILSGKGGRMDLRVGILGTGFAGVHVGALKKIDGVEICGVASRRKETAMDFISKNNIAAAAYGNFKAMLDAEKPDIAYICLPPFAHGDEVAMAARRGIHLFLEKPIALDSAQAEAMVEAIEANGVKSQVGFHMRFRRCVRRLKAMLEDGSAGKPTLFSGRFWANMDGPEWWRDRNRSGGQIFEQVIHIYDLAAYLFGPVARTQGMFANLCHRGRDDYSIEDTSVGTLGFANGAIGVVTGSNCAVPGHFFGDFRAACEKATLDHVCTGRSWIEPGRSTMYHGQDKKDVIIEDEDPYLLENLDFIGAIREGRPTTTPARHGLEVIRLVESVIGSAKWQ
jgi:predicted dehydrogenase